jgi:hypothetical protein
MLPSANRRRSRRHPQDYVVALARKLLVALWQPVTTGEIPQGVVLRPAA